MLVCIDTPGSCRVSLKAASINNLIVELNPRVNLLCGVFHLVVLAFNKYKLTGVYFINDCDQTLERGYLGGNK